MSYKALYRTYRPSTFEEVYGQQHIVKTLSNAIKENKIAHAYLFCGPRGTGKTSMARLFAKALNCEEGFGKQCNHCTNCTSITDGTHPDVIEIDAASNRGIDDIRDLINKVKYAPIRGKYKVYIIDEIHMMTSEAFNALLKTLEEPPANVVFILATTEPFKLMPTILSRVQRYDFSKVSDSNLLANLKRVCEKEGVTFEEEALKLITTLSDGGVRDSLSLLDQAIAYSGNELTTSVVQELFGLSTTEEKLNIISQINKGDIIGCTSKLNQLVEHGVDIKRLTSDLIEILKDLLIYKTTKDASILKMINDEQATSLKIHKVNVTKMIDVFVETYSQYRFVTNIKSLLEIAFIKLASFCTNTENVEEQEVVVKKVVKKLVEVVEEPTKVVKEAPKVAVQEKPVEVKKVASDVPEFKDEGDSYLLSEQDTINLMLQGDKIEKNRIIESWSKLDDFFASEDLGKYATTLKKCYPRIVSKNVLVVDTSFVSVANKVRIKENQKGFSTLVEKITGKEFVILVLTSQESIERVQKFSNLRQANKLPEPYPVNIQL